MSEDLSGRALAHALRVAGYIISREVGSHMRLTTHRGGQHHITILDHESLRVGTLGSILAEVAAHLKLERAALVAELFGA